MRVFLEKWFILLVASGTLATTYSSNNTDISYRIIGGVLASPGEFKFVVGLWIEFTAEREPIRCTGTVLNPNTVLTAGHCISGSQSITVYVNCWNVIGCTDTRTGTGWLHPSYGMVEDITINDIGVVKTIEEIGSEEATKLVNPAPPYSRCTVVGYGATSKGESQTADRFLYKVDVVDIAWCDTIYPRDSRFKNALCSYVRGDQQPYVGDSGGPLLHNKNQVGITSQIVVIEESGTEHNLIVWFVPNQHADWIKAVMEDSAVLHFSSLLVLMLSFLTTSIIS